MIKYRFLLHLIIMIFLSNKILIDYFGWIGKFCTLHHLKKIAAQNLRVNMRVIMFRTRTCVKSGSSISASSSHDDMPVILDSIICPAWKEASYDRPSIAMNPVEIEQWHSNYEDRSRIPIRGVSGPRLVSSVLCCT